MSDTRRLFTTDYFPPVPVEGGGGYRKGTILLDGERLSVSLYVGENVKEDGLAAASCLVSRLVVLRQTAKQAIRQAVAQQDHLVLSYLAVHRDEVQAPITEGRSDTELVDTLRLVGVGVWADEELGYRLVLDFSFGRDVSDELLVAKFSPAGELLCLAHES